MRRTILIYAAALAALTALLKVLEYKYLVLDLKLEFYLGLVAVIFTTLGVWAGLKLTRKHSPQPIPTADPAAAGISKREMEVLELMAKGLSNQEIADAMFVSLNTVKTHAGNLFLKLEVKRRTQAIQKAKQIGLLP